jgi:hypothetical protein
MMMGRRRVLPARRRCLPPINRSVAKLPGSWWNEANLIGVQVAPGLFRRTQCPPLVNGENDRGNVGTQRRIAVNLLSLSGSA